MQTKSKIAIRIKSILTRLHFDRIDESHHDDISTSQQEIIIQPIEKSTKICLQTELEKDLIALNARAHVERSSQSRGLLRTIKKEMDLFVTGGSRGHHLQMIFNHFKTIKPTSGLNM